MKKFDIQSIQVSMYPKKMDIHVSKYPYIQVWMISKYPIIQVSKKNQYPRYPSIRISEKSGIHSSLNWQPNNFNLPNPIDFMDKLNLLKKMEDSGNKMKIDFAKKMRKLNTVDVHQGWK